MLFQGKPLIQVYGKHKGGPYTITTVYCLEIVNTCLQNLRSIRYELLGDEEDDSAEESVHEL